jgi:hypothetical protein
MLGLDLLAEREIEEALARGELDDLPGAGRPLELDDDAMIPEELRAAYRILKNAGYVPPEVETLSSISQLESFLRKESDDARRAAAVRKLALLNMRLEAGYYERALRRLSKI